jgi:predicted nucleic acid-binding Zn ribbon protein
MTIETKTSIKYEYECVECGNDYTEQRNPGVEQFITQCPRCNGDFNLIATTESTYEVDVLEPIVEEEATE